MMMRDHEPWLMEVGCGVQATVFCRSVRTSGDPRPTITIRGRCGESNHYGVDSSWEMRGDRASRIRTRVERYSVQ